MKIYYFNKGNKMELILLEKEINENLGMVSSAKNLLKN